MPVLQVGETKIPYTIRYSKRSKRQRIVVKPDIVEAVAPIGTPQKQIITFVESKEKWLLKAFTQLHINYLPKPTQRYLDGEEVMYRGSYFRLKIEPKDIRRIIISHSDCFHIQIPQDLDDNKIEPVIQQSLIDWKCQQVYPEILKYIKIYAQKLKVTPNSIKLSQQKRAWGTCSSQGNIRINWRLADAPLPVLEYVVAHEVTNLIHPNHSKDFWQTLGKIMPDYQERKANLKIWEKQLPTLQ